MKTIALTLFIALISLTAFGQETPASGATIEVTVENIGSDKGKVLVSLHSKDTFMVAQGIQSLESSVTDGTAVLTFTGVPDGTYAIMAMHDANGNYQMDMDANGMPQEAWGTSGEMNPFGPPSFDLSKFVVDGEDQKFTIRF